MKKLNRPKIKIIAQATEDQMLYDKRLGYGRVVFGTVKNVAKQYRIKMSYTADGLEFEAEQHRMEIFVQRLHFAGIRFKQIS